MTDKIFWTWMEKVVNDIALKLLPDIQPRCLEKDSSQQQWTFIHTSFSISDSRFCMQSSFLLRHRCAAILFLLRLRISWIQSNCSGVNLCIFRNDWKSFLESEIILCALNGSFTWNARCSCKSKVKLIHTNRTIQVFILSILYHTNLNSQIQRQEQANVDIRWGG